MKKLISVLLSLVMLISAVLCVDFVSCAEENSKTELVTDNITVKGTNSVGDMIADTYNETVDEESNGNNVFSVDMDENVATVKMQTVEYATVIVVIYDEAGEKILASGSTKVTPDDKDIIVTVDTESMPQYYYVRCFLVDEESLRPLCQVYESPMYTQAMQEFLATTTEDYNEDLVLNLDENEENNFAVYKEDVTRVGSTFEQNILSLQDDENKQYVIDNADNTIKQLQQGDIFAYDADEENILIVKVKTISVENDTVTVEGDELELEDVFDYVKIDSTATDTTSEYDGSEADECVTAINDTEPSLRRKAPQKRIGGEGTRSFYQKFGIEYKDEYGDSEEDESVDSISVKGTIEYSANEVFKLYLGWFSLYVEYSYSYESNIALEVNGSLSKDIKLGKGVFYPVPAVELIIEFSFVIEYSISVTLTGTVSGTYGFRWDNGRSESLTTTPVYSSELKIAGSIFVGFKFSVSVAPITEFLLKGTISAKVGVAVDAYFPYHTDSQDGIRHSCSNCLTGSISGEFSVSASLKALNSEHLSVSFSLPKATVKILDFYYSKDYNEFEFTTCPHYTFRTRIKVTDTSWNTVENAKVTIGDTEYYTDSNGIVDTYLTKGKVYVSVYKENIGIGSQTIDVSDAPVYTTIRIGKKVPASWFSSNSFNKLPVLNGHVYAVYNESIGWQAAQQYCESLGGHLAAITSEIENDFIYNLTLLSKQHNFYFIGATDEEIEGVWKWVTEEDFMYSNWGSDEPNNWYGVHEQDYACMCFISASGTINGHEWSYVPKDWNDSQEDLLDCGFVCEWESVADYYNNCNFEDVTNPSRAKTKSAALRSSGNTEVTTTEKSFSGLLPDTVYNIYYLKTKEAESPFGTENMLYLAQKVSDSEGNITLTCKTTTDLGIAEEYVIPICFADISAATVTQSDFDYSGEENIIDPVVMLDGKALKRGTDYYISQEYYAVDPGTYTFKILGRGQYYNAVDCEYRVHQWNEGVVTSEQTCTVSGVKTYTCTDCETIKNETIPALGHDYSVYQRTVEPTCTAKGYDVYKCSRCTATQNQNEVAALGHDYQFTGTTEPTCTAKGYDLYTCTRCNGTKKQNEKAALGHDYVVTQDTAATCTEVGVKIEECYRCNDTKTTETAALGHSYAKEYIPATCTEQGYTKYICSRCANTYNDSYFSARGHDYGQEYGEAYLSKLYNDDGTVKTTNTGASYRGEYTSVSSNIKTNSAFSGIGRVKYPNEIRLDAENPEALDAYNFTLYRYLFGTTSLVGTFAYDDTTDREALQSAIPYTDAEGNLINLNYVDYETADGWVTGRFTLTEGVLTDASGNAVTAEYSATRPHIVYTAEQALSMGVMNNDGTVNVTEELINKSSETAITFATGVDGICFDMDAMTSTGNTNFNPFKLDESRTPVPGVYNVNIAFFNASLTGYGSLKIKIYDETALNEISDESTLTHLIVNHTCVDCGEVYTEEEDIDNTALVAAEQRITQYADGDYSAESLSTLREIGQQYNYLTDTPAHQTEYDNATAEILTAISELQPYLNFAVTGDNGIVNVTIDAISEHDGTYSVLFSSEITITATPDEGYEFAGWFETTCNRLFSPDSTYTFKITSNTNLEARFVKVNSASIFFKNDSGYIKSTVTKTVTEWQDVGDITDLLPEVTYEYGSTNGRWVYDVAEVLAKLRAGEDVDIIAEYDKVSENMPDIPTPIDDIPALTLTYSLDAENNVGTFIMAAGIPEGCEVESIGIAFYYKKAASFDPTAFDVNINNKMLTSKFEASNESGHYTVDVKEFTDKYNWAVRGYVTYYDANGNLKTAYTNQINIVDREEV